MQNAKLIFVFFFFLKHPATIGLLRIQVDHTVVKNAIIRLSYTRY